MIVKRNSNFGRTLMCSVCDETEIIIEPKIPKVIVHELDNGEFRHTDMQEYVVRFNDLDAFVICGKCRKDIRVFKEV